MLLVDHGVRTRLTPQLHAAALLALDIALDRWQASNAAESLADCLNAAFDDLLHQETIA